MKRVMSETKVKSESKKSSRYENNEDDDDYYKVEQDEDAQRTKDNGREEAKERIDDEMRISEKGTREEESYESPNVVKTSKILFLEKVNQSQGIGNTISNNASHFGAIAERNDKKKISLTSLEASSKM
jgi:hypothetical protein